VIEIDGATGEGGGQILRSALALSLLLNTPLHMTRIRARRARPGLMRQHLVSVQASRAISDATVLGAELGSTELTFTPGDVRGGEHRFAIGSAGSTTLVLQTILMPLLLRAPDASSIAIEGGTHNSMAPTFDFLERTFMPSFAQLGGTATIALGKHGFYPAGGGSLSARVQPGATLKPAHFLDRGAVRSVRGNAIIANLPRAIANRELRVLAAELDLDHRALGIEEVSSNGPGNVVEVIVECENGTFVFSAFGEKGVMAESVAESAARQANVFLRSSAAVDEHLADQLLLPMAAGAGGSFRAGVLSSHAQTQIDIVRRYLCEVRVTESPSGNLVEVLGGA